MIVCYTNVLKYVTFSDVCSVSLSWKSSHHLLIYLTLHMMGAFYEIFNIYFIHSLCSELYIDKFNNSVFCNSIFLGFVCLSMYVCLVLKYARVH